MRIGDMLVGAGLITEDQLKEILAKQKEEGGKIGSLLVKYKYVEEEDLTSQLSQQYGVPAINLSNFEIDESIFKLIPAETARKYELIPINRTGATLTIAMVDPTNVFAMDDIKFMTGYNVEPVIASEVAILEAIENYYQSTSAIELKRVMDDLTAQSAVDDMEVLDADEDDDELAISSEDMDAAEEAPVIKLVNLIFSDALKRGASDIHLEPYEKEYRVRFRIDGVLYESMRPPLKLRDAIISRIKIMSKLDISERRLPQDGRIKAKMKVGGKIKELDFRVSSLPTLFGEKVVLRLLDKDNLMLDMTRLGFEVDSLKRFERNIVKPYGIILVTGPTGSGKTNTLYSSISRLNSPETNIMTAEDPVEFNLNGINQVQMKDQIGLNFASTLRSFLRQDPNIILVGEIRDFETAEIAIKAALTGHLVLSTLHTNDAPSTINRLMNMGIEPFLVSTSLNLICAQRLIRRVCSECKTEITSVPQALMEIGFPEDEASSVQLYRGEGCMTCNNTGYKGRVGLYEVLEATDDIKELVLCGASAVEIKEKAVEEGMLTLRQSGLQKIRDGVTTVEEVLRETVA